MAEKKINDFTGGLNTSLGGYVKDNQFVIAKNMYYNKDKIIETRRGYRAFGTAIGSSPITSYFFFQKDDGTGQTALCSSGTQMYKYDPTTTLRNSIKTGLHEYELIPGQTSNRTRRDYAVYKNIIYMDNGVDQYASYDGTTYSQGTTTPVVCTFDNTTDIVIKVAHGLSNNAEVAFTTTGALPTGLSANEVYFVVNKTNDNFQVSLTKSGTAVNFTTNGTGTNSYYPIPNPRVRYISYLKDRVFAAGDDTNPITLYYTAALPASAATINTNVLVVGGDENGKINGLSETGSVILSFKSNRIYSVDVSGSGSCVPINTQSGGYSDRSIGNVGTSLVFFNENGISTLTQRTGVDGSQALSDTPLSDDIRGMIDDIVEAQYNASASRYIEKYNNYYFTYDASGDNIPDTTLVYNSLVGAWTQYSFPILYDYGYYINTAGEYQFLFASASGGQMYEFEYGYDDAGASIDYELQTKKFDFDSPGAIKTIEYVDLVGQKSEGTDIVVDILMEGTSVGGGMITDSNVNLSVTTSILSISPIGSIPLTGPLGDNSIPMYRYTIRVPLFASGLDVSVNMSSTGGQRTLEKMRIGVDGEPIDVYYTDQIL